MTDTPKVYAAISKVQGELARHGIGKAQLNAFDKYRFRGIDDVYNALAPLLADAGLVIIPQMRECNSVDRVSQKGGTMVHTTVYVDYLIVSSADGSTVTAKAYGEAIDRGDKSVAKASTSAWKYLMFQLFCIPVQGTPDSDAAHPESGTSIVSANEVAQMRAAFVTLEMDEAKVIGYYKLNSLEEMNTAQFKVVCARIKKRSDTYAKQQEEGTND